MSLPRGAVLLDLSTTNQQKEDLKLPLCTISGYRIGSIVLTIAPNFITNHLKHHDRKKFEMTVKISCYWLDSCSVKEEHLAYVYRIWKVESIDHALNNLKKFNLKPYTTEGDGGSGPQVDVGFMLIQLGKKNLSEEIVTEALSCLSDHSKSLKLTHGQDVFTVYAPFGVNEFMNSVSRGCLSNKLHEGLFLIDGRLAPGCEGAPVFTKCDTSDIPVGIVLFPIAVGSDHSCYSLVVPMHSVLDVFLFSLKSNDIQTVRSWQPSWIQNTAHDGVNNVVAVETTCSWGSGIVVSKGLAVTNAHVVRFNLEPDVTLRWGNHTVTAHVRFHTMRSSPLDVAVLQYNKSFGPPGIKLSKGHPQVGERVLAVGNPLRISSDVPSLSKGIVLNYWKKSVGFSTSCTLNAGSSGGAIVREDGTLLGMVVGICRTNTLAYPEINVCIRASVLQEPLLMYQESGDLSRFQGLTNYNDTWLRSVMNFPKCKY